MPRACSGARVIRDDSASTFLTSPLTKSNDDDDDDDNDDDNDCDDDRDDDRDDGHDHPDSNAPQKNGAQGRRLKSNRVELTSSRS